MNLHVKRAVLETPRLSPGPPDFPPPRPPLLLLSPVVLIAECALKAACPHTCPCSRPGLTVCVFVLFYLSIGSTLKRLCLGKERSSSNYLIYLLTLCLLCPTLFLCWYVHLVVFLCYVGGCGHRGYSSFFSLYFSFCMAVCLPGLCRCLHP